MDNSAPVAKPQFVYHGSRLGIDGALTPRPNHGDMNGIFDGSPRNLVFATHDLNLAATYTLKTEHMLSSGVDNGVDVSIFRDYEGWKNAISSSASSVYALPSASFTQTISKDGKPGLEWTSTQTVMPDHVIKYTPEKVMETGAQLFFLDKKIPKEFWHYDPKAAPDATFSNRIMAKVNAGQIPKDGMLFVVNKELIDAGLMKHLNKETGIKPVMLVKSPLGDLLKDDIEWLKSKMEKAVEPHAIDSKGNPLPLMELALNDIVLDKEHYQFRLSVDANGIDKSHAITEYDPAKYSAPLVVHHRKNAAGNWEYALVDGHHRFDAAKEYAASGKGPLTTKVYVLEEEKGISIKDAKLKAAADNLKLDIEQGKAINIGDAAAVKKEMDAPDPTVHKENLSTLPDMPQAYKLSKLSYHSLGLISSGAVPVKAAEYVVDKVKDSSRFDNIIKEISVKFKQDYANYAPNMTLSTTLTAPANSNAPKNWAATVSTPRQQTTITPPTDSSQKSWQERAGRSNAAITR